MDSLKIKEKMFVLSRTIAKKTKKDLVYYVDKENNNSTFNIVANTNQGVRLENSPAMPKTSLVPFWLQLNEIYEFKEATIRVYDVTPMETLDDLIIAFKVSGDSTMRYEYYSIFKENITDLLSISYEQI